MHVALARAAAPGRARRPRDRGGGTFARRRGRRHGERATEYDADHISMWLLEQCYAAARARASGIWGARCQTWWSGSIADLEMLSLM